MPLGGAACTPPFGQTAACLRPCAPHAWRCSRHTRDGPTPTPVRLPRLRRAAGVPWEQSARGFTGKIVHHEEVARVKALQLAVDAAVVELEKSMDDAPEGSDAPK